MHYNNLEALLLFPLELLIMGRRLSMRCEESDWYEIQVVLPVGSLVVKLFLQRGLLFLGLFNKLLTVVINLAVRDKHATFVGTLGLLTCMFGGGLCISSLPSGNQMLMLHEAEAIDTTSLTQATDIVVDGVMHKISEDEEAGYI